MFLNISSKVFFLSFTCAPIYVAFYRLRFLCVVIYNFIIYNFMIL